MSSVRIYLSGAHSTGKTTILNDLRPNLNISFEEEIARNVIRQHGWSREDFLPDKHPDKFLELNEKILQRQIQLDQENNRIFKDFIADRCIDPLIYIQCYLGDQAKQKLTQIPGFKEWIERLKTALIFVIKPHQECIKDDNVRLPPKLDELQRFHQAIMTEYKVLDIPVYEVSDLNRIKRKDFILDKTYQRFPKLVIY